MARIPHTGTSNPTFGQRGPDRPTAFNPDTSGMDAGARALQGLAGTVGAVAQDYGQQQQRLAMQQRQEDEALARARASNALLDDEIETQTVVEDVQSRIATGDLDWRKAQEEFSTVMDEREVRPIDGLAADDNERYQGGIKRNRFAASAKVRGITEGARRVEFRGQFDASLDKLGKLAGMPGADIGKINTQAEAFTDLAQQAGVDPATIAAKIQVFKDNNWTNQAKGRLMAAQDDPEALKQLEHDLTAGDGFYADKLDTDKRNAVWSQTLTAQSRLESRAQHNETKREAGAERAIAAYDKQIATGVPAPPEFYTDLAEAVKGTSQEGAFQQRIKDEIEVRQVMRKPPAEQRAYLADLTAKQTKDGATVEDQANLQRLKTGVERNLKELKDSPLTFNANRTGLPVERLDLAGLMSGDTRTATAQIADRMVTLRAMRNQYGGEAGNAPLLPEEATALAGALATASPKNAAKLFGTLNSVMSDPEAYNAAMQQIAPDSPVRALAGSIYAKQRTAAPGVIAGSAGATGGDVALKILQGESLLNPGKGAAQEDGKGGNFKMPPPTEVDAEIARVVGTAFAGRPDDYRTNLQAVRAYYAATSADEGDMTGVVDSKRLETAVAAVIGEPVSMEDRDVIPPWGMPAERFEDLADTYIEARFKAAGVENPGDVSLLNVRGRDGLYVITRGMQPLVDKNGQPLLIRMGGVQ